MANTSRAICIMCLWAGSAEGFSRIPAPCEQSYPADGERLPSNGNIFIPSSVPAEEITYLLDEGEGEVAIEPSQHTTRGGTAALISLEDADVDPEASLLTVSCSHAEWGDGLVVGDFEIVMQRDETPASYEVVDTELWQEPFEGPVWEERGVIAWVGHELRVEEEFGIAAVEVLRWKEGEGPPEQGELTLTSWNQSGELWVGEEFKVPLNDAGTHCVSFVLIDYAQNRTPVEEQCIVVDEAGGCACVSSAGRGVGGAAIALFPALFVACRRRRRENDGDGRTIKAAVGKAPSM